MSKGNGNVPEGVEVVWRPHAGPQQRFIDCPVHDVMFGGGRGGGKTESLLGDWMVYADQYGGAARGLLLRRNFPDLTEIVERTRPWFRRWGKYYESEHMWRFNNGAWLRLGFLEGLRDVVDTTGSSTAGLGWMS